MTSNLGFNCMPLFSLCIRALTFLWVLLCCVQLLVTGESAAALNTEERLDFCYLPPKTGPCRAAFHNWFFNNKTNKCEQFIYGGCNGNQNNFETEANCAETCKASQTGNKTSGDNFLHHENGQGGNNLPGKNGDDENEQKEKEDSMGKTAKEYFELLNKGIHPEKSVPFLPQPRIFKRSARSLKKQTKEYGASLPISEHNLQTGNKTSGEDERNGKGSSGQNGDGEDRHKEKSLTGEKGDDETRQKAEGLPGQNGDGEDSHKEKSLTGEKGDDETRQKAEGLQGQNGDGEDRHKEKSLTGEKGDDETRPKAEGLQGQNGDGEDRHKEKSLTGEKGDDGTRYSSRRGPEGNVNGGDFRLKDRKSGVYGDSDSYEHTSSHFAGFFLTSIVLVFAVYAVYHNRQKIVAIIIEGRNDNRSGKRGYRKLETNVEEAMPAMKNTHSTYVY